MTSALDNNWGKLKFTIDQIRIEYQKNADIHPSEQMSDLLILGEDRRFKFHCGVDPLPFGGPLGGPTGAVAAKELRQ